MGRERGTQRIAGHPDPVHRRKCVRCYFGGGTAIVLRNGEYRLSLYVDFLCANLDGYRELRVAARGKGAQAVFGSDVETLRPFVAYQYGIRGLFSLLAAGSQHFGAFGNCFRAFGNNFP